MQLSSALLREQQLIRERLVENEDKETFDDLCKYYERTEDDLKTLFIRYRHLLKDVFDPKWGTVSYQPLNRPIRIGYLLNTDIVFYSELDDVMSNYLRNEGAEVIQFKMEDIRISATTGGLQLYIKKEPAQFDGFMSYGYRSKSNMQAYTTLVKLMEQKGVVCLHSHYHELILNDKMLQATHFSASNVPIPDTYQVFSISSAKDLVDEKLTGASIIKYLNDYGGDSVFKVEDKYNTVNAVAKNLWRGEHVIVQKMIPDSFGESVRVLCIEGEAFAMMKYEDVSGDFRSNVSMGDKFRCVSLMNDPKYKLYKEIAEKAVHSIGNVLIGGVDILDSKTDGAVVLEINSFPDIYDIWYTTKMCTFKRLAEGFMSKIRKSIDKENVEIIYLE